ncbi:hypothetical protein WJX84_002275 [Apatococcus fuscideae]|uniref:Uncharacterized protein n=1 Tax=Apatococcus fuscideae TaxID=2026836 RepID=A0AAW1SYU6_9CHLO
MISCCEEGPDCNILRTCQKVIPAKSSIFVKQRYLIQTLPKCLGIEQAPISTIASFDSQVLQLKRGKICLENQVDEGQRHKANFSGVLHDRLASKYTKQDNSSQASQEGVQRFQRIPSLVRRRLAE